MKLFSIAASLIISFLCVSFGIPVWGELLSVVAAACGYALFWRTLFYLPKYRPLIAFFWFCGVQAIQLGWLASTVYMGPFIFVVYGFLVLAIGLQFSWITSLIRFPLSYNRMLAISGLWVFMEWIRLLPLTGFPWNPVGLSLASHDWSIQWASLFGIYGLSFWVIFTNLVCLLWLRNYKKTSLFSWMSFALLPYLFGFAHESYWRQEGEPFRVALVGTNLRQEQKELFPTQPEAFISPLIQWQKILTSLKETGASQFDLIVLPEAALPWGERRLAYPSDLVKQVWGVSFGKVEFVSSESKVSNRFWAEHLAKHFQAEVIIGLDALDSSGKYNAAFHFLPTNASVERYEKQLLVPVGEYIPFQSFSLVSAFVADQFGIGDSFDAGKKTGIFQGKTPIGVSICSEEAYSNLVRKTRLCGAKLLVNIANDGWFPNTSLPWHHFHQGRLRAAENGACVLRSCNQGVTSAIDPFGKAIAILPDSLEKPNVLSLNLSISSHPTLYTFWGDWPILLLSFGFVAIFLLGLRKRLIE